MRFRVGPRIYTAAISADPLYRDDDELLGVTDHTERKIFLAPDCPLQGRAEVLLHELGHGWFHQLGIPIDEESAADMFAMMSLALQQDLKRQGGLDAIETMEMRPDERFDAACLNVSLSELRPDRTMQCSKCEQRIGSASIAVSAARHDPAVASLVVDLAFYCPGCNHIQSWRELATQGGKPTGAWAGKVEYLTGDDCLAFCEQHSEKCESLESF